MIRNDNIEKRVQAAPTLEKMVKTRIWWFELVDVVVRKVDQMEDNQINRGRGRLKKTIKINLEIIELDKNMVYDRAIWHRLINVVDST